MAIDYKFSGWKPDGKNITGNTDCIAQFSVASQPEEYKAFINAIKAGTDSYEVGSSIPVILNDGNTYHMQIVGKNVDQLADGSGNAKYSIILDELLSVGEERWNPYVVTNSDGSYKEGTGNIGGWEKSEIRAYYKNTLKPMLPDDLQKLIKPVKKSYTYWPTAKDGTYQRNGECTDDVWMPSLREMAINDTKDYIEASGPVYKNAFQSYDMRKKHVVNESSSKKYWLRSANSYGLSVACCVGSGGGWSGVNVNNGNYVALGFCI